MTQKSSIGLPTLLKTRGSGAADSRGSEEIRPRKRLPRTGVGFRLLTRQTGPRVFSPKRFRASWQQASSVCCMLFGLGVSNPEETRQRRRGKPNEQITSRVSSTRTPAQERTEPNGGFVDACSRQPGFAGGQGRNRIFRGRIRCRVVLSGPRGRPRGRAGARPG